MRTGIMLPNGIPGRPAGAIAEWAARAEARGFDSVGVIDRVVYDCVDPFVALATAAAVTEHVDLMTDLVVAPLRDTTLLATQASSLDALSGGRLRLGLGVGIREDDFAAVGASYPDRGRRFDSQLEQMRAIWDRSVPYGAVPARPGGPRLMIGGAPEKAGPRLVRHGGAWTMAIGTPEQFAAGREAVTAAWRDGGRTGAPETVALVYTAAGPDAAALVEHAVTSYYAWLGPELTAWIVAASAAGEDALARSIEDFAAAGADELVLVPCTADPAQLDLLADVAVASSFTRVPEGHLA